MKKGNSVDKHPRLAVIVLIASLLVCLFLAAAQTAVEPDINDEHMYLAAAKLLDHHELYRDYAFMQTPYMVILYHWAMHLFPESGMLMIARSIKLLLVGFTLLLLSILLYRFSRSYWSTVLLLMLFFSSAIFRSDLHMARNYQLPLLLTLWALLFLDVYLKGGGKKTALIFLAGFCLGLAVGVKLTYVLTGMAVVLVFPWFIKGVLPRLKALTWFLFGGIGALLPLIGFFSRAGWKTMVFNLLDYHRLNGIWRSSSSFDQGMDALGKFLLGLGELMQISNVGVLIVLFLLILLTIRGQEKRAGGSVHRIWILSGLIISALFFYIVPTPAWIWYLSPLWLFLALLDAELLNRAANIRERKALHYLVLLLVVLASITNMGNEKLNLERAMQPGEWRPQVLNRNAQELKAALSVNRHDGKVATLRPLYALEAQLQIYPELASADFGYRVGAFLSEEERRTLHVTSLESLDVLLKQDPPAALILGFDAELEQPFLRYALENGYTLRRDLIPGARVYLRPETR